MKRNYRSPTIHFEVIVLEFMYSKLNDLLGNQLYSLSKTSRYLAASIIVLCFSFCQVTNFYFDLPKWVLHFIHDIC